MRWLWPACVIGLALESSAIYWAIKKDNAVYYPCKELGGVYSSGVCYKQDAVLLK